MTVQLTAVSRPVPGGYVAYVEQLRGANRQAATLDEAWSNLEEAVSLVLEANRTLARGDAADVEVIREPLSLTVCNASISSVTSNRRDAACCARAPTAPSSRI